MHYLVNVYLVDCMKVTLSQENIRSIFSSSLHQDDVLDGLYRQVFPEWDFIDYIIQGRPRIGKLGWRAIFDMFERFDEEHHSQDAIVPGYFWIGLGFSADEMLEDWEVDTSDVRFSLKADIKKAPWFDF